MTCVWQTEKSCQKDKSESEKKSDLNPNEIMKEEEKDDNQEYERSVLWKNVGTAFYIRTPDPVTA